MKECHSPDLEWGGDHQVKGVGKGERGRGREGEEGGGRKGRGREGGEWRGRGEKGGNQLVMIALHDFMMIFFGGAMKSLYL